VSPSSAEIDRKDKFKQYAAGEVPYYWIIDPQLRTLEGYQLAGAQYRLVGRASGDEIIELPPIPDLEIPLGQLWLPESLT
jgi:Uma2 family endonuclease